MTNDTGFVLWLTGLSGAGKSTIARGIAPRLLERGHRLEVLDGDEVRTNLCQELGFSREDRDTNIARIGYVAGRLAKHGVAVVVAAISPYREARDKVRASVPNFVEVHVAAPVEVCAERDVKGLYAKALAGEIKNFTGVSDPYEPPVAPEIVLHTEAETVGESVEQVLAWLEANQLTILADTWSPNRDGAALGGNVDHGHPSLVSDPWNQSSRVSRSLGRPIESNAQPDGLTGGWR